MQLPRRTPALWQPIRPIPIHSILNSYHTTHRLAHDRSQRASDKLFADAAREEAEGTSQGQSKSQKLKTLEQEHENWTGDENIKDTVLRMLVDKYKPLRGSAIVSADQKLKQAPPKVWSASSEVPNPTSKYMKPHSGSWADVPLLPSSDTHKPWETTFKAPSQDAFSVKLARIPLQSPGAPNSMIMDERLVRREKEKMKKVQRVERLGQALESTLDYKLGIKHGRGPVGRPIPTSMKGWNSLIEERIERARLDGVFKNVKGRGQPIARSHDETNPFIAREEFLMNRIVQRNGAAPPWIEVQYELDSAVNTFRELLRQSWIRRGVRILTMNNPTELLHTITLHDVITLRDSDWLKKEQSYHDTAVAELNSLVRKYNGLAPYAVRRPYYIRQAEIERMYEASAEEIMRELEERVQNLGLTTKIGGVGSTGRSGRGAIASSGRSESVVTDTSGQGELPRVSWRIRDMVWEWFDKISSRWKQ